MQAWGRLQLGQDPQHDTDGAIPLAFLSTRYGPATLTLGRQLIAPGAARMARLDGANLVLDLPADFSAQGYFGAATTRRFHFDRGTWLAGARLAKRMSTHGTVGFSLRQQRREGQVDREELGLDTLWTLGPVRAVGFVFLSPREHGISEGELQLLYQPTPAWTVSGHVRRSTPGLRVGRASIFSVFGEGARDELGAHAQWRPDPYLDITLSGDSFLAPEGLFGYRGSLASTLYREKARRNRIGAEVVRLAESRNGYLRGRLFATLAPWPAIGFSAEMVGYRYDAPLNGSQLALWGRAAATYSILDDLRLTVDVDAGTTPLARSQVKIMARLTYGYAVSFGDGPAPLETSR